MLPENSVDLIYLDPPFFSNRVYEGDLGGTRQRFARSQIVGAAGSSITSGGWKSDVLNCTVS